MRRKIHTGLRVLATVLTATVLTANLVLAAENIATESNVDDVREIVMEEETSLAEGREEQVSDFSGERCLYFAEINGFYF
ncbi:MAG: hypothetical protein Q4B70_05175 [Lachnospiraceae bacterium]|nr:hypothetical protein [Lachnospiraceae bacterium]